MPSIKDFLISEKIPYHHFWYYMNDTTQKKTPIGEKNNATLEEIAKKETMNKPEYKSKKSNGEWVQIPFTESEKKSLVSSYTIFMKYCQNLYCVDIDDKEIHSMDEFVEKTGCDIFKNCCWVKGNTKGIHIYLKIENMIEYSNQQNVYNLFQGDLIKTNNMWEKCNKEVLNYSGSVPSFEYENIKHIFNDRLNIQDEKKVKKERKKISLKNEVADIDSTKNKEIETSFEYLYIKLAIEEGVFKKKISVDYDTWTQMGWSIFNIFGTQGWNLFLDFSKQSPKFDDDNKPEIWEFWNSIDSNHNNPSNFGSIVKLVQDEDKAVDFKIQKMLEPLTAHASTGHISDYFKIVFGHKFIYCDEVLYYFNGIYWKKDDSKESFLNKFIDKEFIIYVRNHHIIKSDYYNKKCNTDNPEEKNHYENSLSSINAHLTLLNKNLRNYKSRQPYIDDILTKITNNDAKFDEKPNLFAFENAIYDLYLGDFVKPESSQMVSITTGYEYDFKLNTQNDILDKIIDEILPDKVIQKYALEKFSTGLYGILIQKLILLIGVGGNGKSFLEKMIRASLGNYAYVMPSAVLLQEIKTGPNPEVANMHNVRLVITSEPTRGKSMNTSTMNQITGDSTLPARMCNSNRMDTNNRSTLFLICNKAPKLDDVNLAVSRRADPIPFDSRFRSQEDYDKLVDKTNAFILNPEFETPEFISKQRQFIFHRLAESFKEYRERKFQFLPTPPKCMEMKNEYLATSDDIYGWFSDVYEPDENALPFSFKEVFKTFTNGEYYSNMTKQDKRTNNFKYFSDKIEKNLFIQPYIKNRNTYHNKIKLNSDSIVGWRIKQEEVKCVVIVDEGETD
jgi:P4 family phage/plasmid primase-like protien